MADAITLYEIARHLKQINAQLEQLPTIRGNISDLKNQTAAHNLAIA